MSLGESPSSRIPLPTASGARDGTAIDLKPRIIRASQHLRQKAVNRQRGLDLILSDDIRRKIDMAIAKAGPSFETETLKRLHDIRQLLSGLGASGDDFALIFVMPQLYDLAFDVKGMGGMFGYHLLTDLAKSLQDFLARIDLPTASEFEIVAIHIDAIYLLLAQKIRGQGGDLERELLINLGYAADKVSTVPDQD